MSLYVTKDHIIEESTRQKISLRYHSITKTVNREMWNINSDVAHSLYVGSYGRGTAVDSSDIDILVEIPESYHVHNTGSSYNPQSRLLQVVKNVINTTYSNSEISADGQVVDIEFSDGMLFEILPAFPHKNYWENIITYEYPDTHNGGRWLPTNPKAEQNALKAKNNSSKGLLFDTCKHIRYIHNEYFKSSHLSGIVIDSFVYNAMGLWSWSNPGSEGDSNPGDYEESLLEYYNRITYSGYLQEFNLRAPGSNQSVNTKSSCECLGKVLHKMAD